MNTEILWNNFLGKIKERISSLSYDTWFKDTKLYKIENGTATIVVPMSLHKKHLEENYLDEIEEIFNGLTDTNFNFQFKLENEILEEEALVNELDDNEKKEVLDNVNLLYKLIVYLNGKEKEFDENEEIRDTYFDYENHKNKIVYLSNNILKDIESIDDFKTLKDLYGLLIGIKEGRIPVKSHMQKMQIPNRKIKKIRPNSNNSQARINCEILGNNTFGIVLINAKKDTTTDKSTITSINERLKMYNPDTVLDSLDMEKQKEYDREVYDLIMGKLNKKMAK